MNKKGFTLIELLAIIIILSLIMMIAVPTFSKYILKTESKYYNNLEKSLIESSKEYLGENKQLYPKEVKDYYLITKDDLLNSGIIEKITDKNGNQCQEARVYVQKEKQGKYNYYAYIECGNYKTNNKDIIDKIINGSGISDDTPPSVAKIEIKGKTTNSIRLKGICKDLETGIREYQYSNDGGRTFISAGKNDEYVFNGLESGKEYEFKVRCINGANMKTDSERVKGTTANMSNATIIQVDEERKEGYTWATMKEYQVSYPKENIENPTYYYKSTMDGILTEGIISGICGIESVPKKCIWSGTTVIKAGTWYKTESEKIKVKYYTIGTIYALIGDGVSISGGSSYNVTNLSSETPSQMQIAGGNPNWITDNSSITIKVVKESTELSGIKEVQCYSSTKETEQVGGKWEECENTLTYNTEQHKYITYRAIANNGLISPISNVESVKIDRTKPNVTATADKRNIKITMSDATSGIYGYSVTTSASVPTNWTTGTTNIYTATKAGTYYVHVRDNAGNTNYASATLLQKDFCSYNPGQVWNYDYTGGVQSFTAPDDGIYRLEVWGGMGQLALEDYDKRTIGYAGMGGYSSGYKQLRKGQTLYICVGGGHTSNIAWSNEQYSHIIYEHGSGTSYNGGGEGDHVGTQARITGGAGGGATHIATTNRGVLSNYASYRGEILIVAGGGGGGCIYYDQMARNGGAGGGLNGEGSGPALGWDYQNDINTNGGCQTGPGSWRGYGYGASGGFGYGADGIVSGVYTSGGAGGGWYGGSISAYGSGIKSGGGSGYIGGVPTFSYNGVTYSPSTTAGQRWGSGYARITLIRCQ